VAAYTRTFISRFDRYPVQRNDGKYASINELLTVETVAAHLLGKKTIGTYALDSRSQAKWVCFDADDDQEWRGLLTLADDLKQDYVPSYSELSSRGGHLWLFFTPQYGVIKDGLSGQDARRFAKQLLAGRNLDTVEIYPKQDQLQTGTGSLMRLPLGIHRKTGKRYHFIKLDGTPLAPTIRHQIAALANPQTVPPSFVTDILKRAPEAKPLFPTPKFVSRPNKIIGETPSERIKNRISVYDFVSQYVQLDRGGIGLCPFHDDHAESFGVNQEGNFWNCFSGCGGGSVIDFWMKWRELHGQDASFTATITELAQLLL
jgi:hypothetical protein